MAFNLFLAFLPVLFIWLYFAFKNKVLKGLFLILWLLYLPNSIYIITDLIHLFEDWASLTYTEKLVVLFQHITFELLGLFAFLLAMYPFEKILRKSQWKKQTTLILVALNFLLGFAMVLGRVDRVNSWNIVTNPTLVLRSTIHTITSIDLFSLAILFGLFANLFYFLFRKNIKDIFSPSNS
jgi:uncharacterized membrane protein